MKTSNASNAIVERDLQDAFRESAHSNFLEFVSELADSLPREVSRFGLTFHERAWISLQMNEGMSYDDCLENLNNPTLREYTLPDGTSIFYEHLIWELLPLPEKYQIEGFATEYFHYKLEAVSGYVIDLPQYPYMVRYRTYSGVSGITHLPILTKQHEHQMFWDCTEFEAFSNIVGYLRKSGEDYGLLYEGVRSNRIIHATSVNEILPALLKKFNVLSVSSLKYFYGDYYTESGIKVTIDTISRDNSFSNYTEIDGGIFVKEEYKVSFLFYED